MEIAMNDRRIDAHPVLVRCESRRVSVITRFDGPLIEFDDGLRGHR
jgi:hypothetical protein